MSVLALALALALGTSDPSITLFGIGAKSCTSALAPAKYGESFAWVMGWFSALNAEKALTVGHSTDGAGIMAEAKLACSREPSLPLFAVADRVYNKLRATAR